MGKASRFACIIVPEALSVASLICLLMVFLAGLNKNDPNLRALYYFKSNTTGLKNEITSLSVGNVNLGNIVHSLVGSTANISDFYEIYMWNYCRGSTVNGTETVTYCSPRQAKYSFDPFTEWGLSSSTALKVVNGSIDSAVHAYQKGSAWMFVAYTVAFWVTVATIVVGLFAICSRVGSCLTTFVSSAATLFTIIAAVISTILFSTVVGALNASLSVDGIHSSLGTRMIALDWLAAAFSLGASFFWLVSICCCSPHSSSRRKDRNIASSNVPPQSNVAAFAPFGNRGYQPLADPQTGHVPEQTAYAAPTAYGGRGGGVEMQDLGYTGAAGPYKGRDSAYEPFRHERV